MDRDELFRVLENVRTTVGQQQTPAQIPEATSRRLRQELLDTLHKDPLLKEFIQACRGAKIRLTAPWMARGEQKATALISLLGPALFYPPTPKGFIFTEEQRVVGFAFAVLAGQTYLWSREVLRLVKSYPLPPHTISKDLLPFPLMYHTFEVPYDVHFAAATPDFPIPESEGENNWAFMQDGGDGFQLVQDFSVLPPRRVLLESGITYGTRYPDDFSPAQLSNVSLALGMLAFLRSPYIEVEQCRLPRGLRRRGVTQTDKDTTVGVVRLREPTRRAVHAYGAEEIERRHHWWVAGHFRSQWYPSKQGHEVIWIAPHVKGPLDKPLLEKVYHVVR